MPPQSRPPFAAANDDSCPDDRLGVPVVAAWGMGVDSTALLCGESISAYDVYGCRRRPAAIENH